MIYSKCGAGIGWGMLSCVGYYILQEFNILFLTRFRTYNIALPPETKTWEGRGPQTDKHLPAKSLYRQFYKITTFGIAFCQSNLSTWISIMQLRRRMIGGQICSAWQSKIMGAEQQGKLASARPLLDKTVNNCSFPAQCQSMYWKRPALF